MPELPCVAELLGLPSSQCLAECSRCGESQFPLLQLRVIYHQVALCRTCLRRLLNILEHWRDHPKNGPDCTCPNDDFHDRVFGAARGGIEVLDDGTQA